MKIILPSNDVIDLTGQRLSFTVPTGGNSLGSISLNGTSIYTCRSVYEFNYLQTRLLVGLQNGLTSINLQNTSVLTTTSLDVYLNSQPPNLIALGAVTFNLPSGGIVTTAGGSLSITGNAGQLIQINGAGFTPNVQLGFDAPTTGSALPLYQVTAIYINPTTVRFVFPTLDSSTSTCNITIMDDSGSLVLQPTIVA